MTHRGGIALGIIGLAVSIAAILFSAFKLYEERLRTWARRWHQPRIHIDRRK